mmetsp:Transcript_21355/g.48234  ORF Transcript_21355/g.48234 Transcript_21355/m.48234 type:complete len:151 (-) Transcript_21355:1562-2014(-)
MMRLHFVIFVALLVSSAQAFRGISGQSLQSFPHNCAEISRLDVTRRDRDQRSESLSPPLRSGGLRASMECDVSSSVTAAAKQAVMEEGVKRNSAVVTNEVTGFSWIPVGAASKSTSAEQCRSITGAGKEVSYHANSLGFAWIPVSSKVAE